MDEKLRKSLTAIICDIVECTEPLDCDMASTCPYVIDGLPQIEQAFREAGLLEPQQPAGGELVENPYPDAHYPGCQNEVFAHGSEAQHAHDKTRIQTLEIDYQMLSEEAKGLSDENKELKARMVRLPTELWLAEHLHSARFEWKDNWRDYKNREQVGGNLYGFMAKRLLNWLKEQKP